MSLPSEFKAPSDHSKAPRFLVEDDFVQPFIDYLSGNGICVQPPRLYIDASVKIFDANQMGSQSNGVRPWFVD